MITRDGRDGSGGGEGGDSDGTEAAFAAIVSGLTDLSWTHTPAQLDEAATAHAGSRSGPAGPDPGGAAAETEPVTSAAPSDDRSAADTARDRDARRAARRAERAEQIEAFEAELRRRAAEMAADDQHFVPPDPPPLPRLRGRTSFALILLVLGVLAMARPSLLAVAPDVVLVLGLLLVMAGLALLISGLRARSADPDGGDGWDDGARL